MNNAYFVAFHQGMSELISSNGDTDLGLVAADLTAYRNKITLLNDAVLGTQGSDKTAQIAAYEAERDKLFRGCRNTLANLKNSGDPDLVALYDTAKAKILAVYPSSIASESNQEETAHINGFLVDVRKYFGTQLDALGLTKQIAALDTANQNFQTAYLDRAAELSEVVTGATVLYRKEVEELYAKMELTINYFASRTDATDTATQTLCSACTAFVTLANEYIDEIWQSIKLGKSLSKGDDSSSSSSSSSGSSSSSSSSSSSGSSSSGSSIIDL